MQNVGQAEKRGFTTPLKRKGQIALTQQQGGYWACTVLFIDDKDRAQAPAFTAPSRQLAYFAGYKFIIETFGADSIVEPL